MDILKCGACQLEFALANITLFIEHKKQDCDEERGRRFRNSQTGLVCTSCSRTFKSAWDLLQHVQNAHSLSLYEETKSCGDCGLLREGDIADHSDHELPRSPPVVCSPLNTYQMKRSDRNDDCVKTRESTRNTRPCFPSDIYTDSYSKDKCCPALSPQAPLIENTDFEEEVVPLDLKISTRGREAPSVSSTCPSDTDIWTSSPSSLHSPFSIDNSSRGRHIPTIPKKRKWTNLVQNDDQSHSPRSTVSVCTCTSPDTSPPTSPAEIGLRAALDPGHKPLIYDTSKKTDDSHEVPRLDIPLKWKYSYFAGSSNGILDSPAIDRETKTFVQSENRSPMAPRCSNCPESPSYESVQQRTPPSLAIRDSISAHSGMLPEQSRYAEYIDHEQSTSKNEESPITYMSSPLSKYPQYNFPAQNNTDSDYSCLKRQESNTVPKSPDSSGLDEYDTNHNYCKSLLADTQGYGKKRRYPTSRPFKCDHCDHSFNQRIHLKKHLSKHTGVKPFKCSLCDYSTVERSHLKVHIRIHTGEKPFKCTFCDYATAQNSTLKIHLKRHHGGKMFECRECGKCFTQVDMLDSHVRVHHLDVPSTDQLSPLAVSAHTLAPPVLIERPMEAHN